MIGTHVSRASESEPLPSFLSHLRVLPLKLSHEGRPSTLERHAGESGASGRAGDLQRADAQVMYVNLGDTRQEPPTCHGRDELAQIRWQTSACNRENPCRCN
jgi:hypothetical protein